MGYCDVKRVWTDSEDKEFSEYLLNINNDRVSIKEQSYYIASSEIVLAMKKLDEFNRSKKEEISITFGKFGTGFPPAMQMKLKRMNSFKNLFVTITCEIDIEGLENEIDVCQLSFHTDTILIEEFLRDLKSVSEFKKETVEIQI